MKIQTKLAFKAIQLDAGGNVFVLSGNSAEHKSRDVFVLSAENGELLTTVTLPNSTHKIYIDSRNDLYSRAGSGTCLKRYEIVYE